MHRFLAVLAMAAAPLCAQTLPDGLYADLHTSKGRIIARLDMDLTPMTVANFVGLAEGTIANAAFDIGQPFFDGTVYHRVVPGHVIQTGIPKSDRARGPGYTFPNEIDARLSHNHAGALNMANSGPGTNSSQFCITLGDRSYLDGDYTVFGDVVQGLDIVMTIVQGDVLERVKILRVGAKAQAFHPTTESFQAMVKAAQQRVAEQAEKKKQAEREWIARHYPKASGPEAGVLSERLAEGHGAEGAARFRYRGIEVRYLGYEAGRSGPPIEEIEFASGDTGRPGFVDAPREFAFEPGKTKINPGLDGVLAGMKPGERRVAIVPASLGYKRSGYYAPEVPGKKRLVISPETMVVFDVEAVGN